MQDAFERRTQFASDAGDQLAGSGKFFAAEKLFAQSVLLLQLQGSRHLIREMLRGRLFLLAEEAQLARITDFQHAEDVVLREQRKEHRGTGQPGFPRGLYERAAADVGNVQQCAIPKTHDGSAGQSILWILDGDGHGLGIRLDRDVFERLGAPVEEVEAHGGRLSDGGQNGGKLLGDIDGRGSRDNLFTQCMKRAHGAALRGGMLVAVPPQSDQCRYGAYGAQQHERRHCVGRMSFGTGCGNDGG